MMAITITTVVKTRKLALAYACIMNTVNDVWSTYTEHWSMFLWRMGFRQQLPELHLLPQPKLAVCKMKEKK
jgi:hypothetical protein